MVSILIFKHFSKKKKLEYAVYRSGFTGCSRGNRGFGHRLLLAIVEHINSPYGVFLYKEKRCYACKEKKTLDSSRYLPCRCIDDSVTDKDEESSYITAFIDESIHPVLWNRNGVVGREGSYSYILCKGKLKKETQITEEGIIAQTYNIRMKTKMLWE